MNPSFVRRTRGLDVEKLARFFNAKSMANKSADTAFSNARDAFASCRSAPLGASEVNPTPCNEQNVALSKMLWAGNGKQVIILVWAKANAPFMIQPALPTNKCGSVQLFVMKEGFFLFIYYLSKMYTIQHIQLLLICIYTSICLTQEWLLRTSYH